MVVIDFTMLKDIRDDYGINQETMAKILGVKRSTYSLWELGINIIPLKNLCDFADYFNLSIDYVLGLTNNRNNKSLRKGLDIKKLGNNMKNIRIYHHLSQEDVATILNVTQACITKYERGDIFISTSNLYKFSKRFKVSLSEVCGKGSIEQEERLELIH